MIAGASGDDAVDFGGVTDDVDVHFGDGEVNCQCTMGKLKNGVKSGQL